MRRSEHDFGPPVTTGAAERVRSQRSKLCRRSARTVVKMADFIVEVVFDDWRAAVVELGAFAEALPSLAEAPGTVVQAIGGRMASGGRMAAVAKPSSTAV